MPGKGLAGWLPGMSSNQTAWPAISAGERSREGRVGKTVAACAHVCQTFTGRYAG